MRLRKGSLKVLHAYQQLAAFVDGDETVEEVDEQTAREAALYLLRHSPGTLECAPGRYARCAQALTSGKEQ